MYTGTLILLNIYIMIIMYEFEQVINKRSHATSAKIKVLSWRLFQVRNDSSQQTNDYEIIEHVQSKVSYTLWVL